MKLKVAAVLFASTLAVSAIGGVAADSKNWSPEKELQVMRNRVGNAGIGNGGERPNGNATANGEDGGPDVDPGNSGAQNQVCVTPDGEAPADTAC